MTLYRGQYPLFGDAQVMPVKVIWDYTYYWSLLAPLATCPGGSATWRCWPAEAAIPARAR